MDREIFTLDKLLSPLECSVILGTEKTDIDLITGDYSVKVNSGIKMRIHNAFRNYLKERSVPDLYKLQNIKVQKTNGNIPRHHDLEMDKNGKYLRHFTVLVSLNGGEISGGELFFPRHGRLIKPSTGGLIIFPVGVLYPHQVLPCTTKVCRHMLEFTFSLDYDHPEFDIEHGAKH